MLLHHGFAPSAPNERVDMPNEQSVVDLPNEIWLCILRILIQPCESDRPEHTTFFPPGIDLTLLLGFKNVSRRFRALANHVELSMRDGLVSVRSVSEIRGISIPPEDLR